MGINLSKRQREILDFITEFMNDHGYAPSLREIGEYFNLSSPATIHEHINNLKKKGFLKASYNSARSIELVNERVDVPSDMVRDEANSYVLRVRGESMIEDGILDGDFVVVERNPSPRNGDIVVALLDNAYATLKRFYREANRIRLQPANSTMKPFYAKDPLIQGVVRGVIRKFA